MIYRCSRPGYPFALFMDWPAPDRSVPGPASGGFRLFGNKPSGRLRRVRAV
jgi:hypothetical protein